MAKTGIETRIGTMKNEDAFLEVFTKSSVEGKKHLTSSQFNSYLFNKSTLDKETLAFVENHISVCERCRSQVSEVENNKEFYQSLPKID
ncbi:zf-HC2 domain-containing protein [Flavobacterium lindanitolerans]|uniref:zf-HC2 domain-containing protein n=1 Tax=Flavobacterium lindanitolerans TaxID=428988 RepID=UPI0027B8B12F|nr:zf-HC2 domain-containing protein [Flavobacterium lindanitolerans]